MKPDLDAAVVGAGPVGCFAALNLAKLGAKVEVFEEHPTIGAPSHCAGHLSIRSLSNLGLFPLPDGIVENTFSGANFYSPIGTKFSIRLAKPVTCSINRERFDRFLAEKAQASGAVFNMTTRAESLVIEDGFVKGVNVEQKGRVERRVSAGVVVDAEGVSSRILKQTGLRALNTNRLVYAVEAEAENVKNVEPDAVEVFLGEDYAPGFYAWLIPRRDGTAKVGLATRAGNPKKFLERLRLKHPIASKQLANARITRAAFHSITLGGPIPKTFSNGFLAIGDAASQVKPTTGGGVILGLSCARIAAETLIEAIQRQNFNADTLSLYQKRCDELLGFDVGAMLRIRRLLDSLSDKRLDNALRFAARMGLAEAWKDVEEIDFQGQTLLKTLAKPAGFAALAYFLLLYLTANP
jgi:digeranylgeranylglycerophospholipid reductase